MTIVDSALAREHENRDLALIFVDRSSAAPEAVSHLLRVQTRIDLLEELQRETKASARAERDAFPDREKITCSAPSPIGEAHRAEQVRRIQARIDLHAGLLLESLSDLASADANLAFLAASPAFLHMGHCNCKFCLDRQR